MTLQTVSRGFVLPSGYSSLAAAPTYTTTAMTIDASGDKAAFILQVTKTGNIHKVHFRTAATHTANGNADVRLETLSAAATPATPSGTLWGTNTNGTQAVAAANTWYTTTLTADAAVTEGDQIAVVIVADGTLNTNIAAFGDDTDVNFSYPLLFTASWATVSGQPIVVLEYDDGTTIIPPGCHAFSAINTNTYNTGSTPDSYGLQFQLPFGFRIRGGWFWNDLDGDAAIRLVSTSYNQGAGTGILTSVSWDKDVDEANTAGVHWFWFTAGYECSASTNYRLLIEPTTGTSLTLYDYTVNSSAIMDATDGGNNFHLTTAKDPTGNGSWTNYNNGTDGYRKPFIGIIVDGIEIPAGGGGGTGGSYMFAA